MVPSRLRRHGDIEIGRSHHVKNSKSAGDATFAYCDGTMLAKCHRCQGEKRFIRQRQRATAFEGRGLPRNSAAQRCCPACAPPFEEFTRSVAKRKVGSAD